MQSCSPLSTLPPPLCAPVLILMGFFSSRRHDSDVLSNSTSAQSQSTSSSPGIIRSRFVRINAAQYFFLAFSSLARPLYSLQYGRNKDKGKAREVKSTPSRGVSSPSAESRKEPSVNDTLRTINGHRTIPDSGTRDVSEPPLHSPVSQKAPKSPSSSNPRASTDAITHVSHSQSHPSTADFLSIMLSQRLAELASANAEGLLEYVVLMKRISDLGD